MSAVRSAHPSLLPSPPGSSLRVLVVDDDAADAAQLAAVLGDRLGVEALTRPDAYQGLDVLLSERIDVALVDLSMPGATGLQLVARLRREGSTTPVIIMNELVIPNLVAQVEAFPATTLVEKSPDMATLIAAVEKLLSDQDQRDRLVADGTPRGRRPRSAHPLLGKGALPAGSTVLFGSGVGDVPAWRLPA